MLASSVILLMATLTDIDLVHETEVDNVHACLGIVDAAQRLAHGGPVGKGGRRGELRIHAFVSVGALGHPTPRARGKGERVWRPLAGKIGVIERIGNEPCAPARAKSLRFLGCLGDVLRAAFLTAEGALATMKLGVWGPDIAIATFDEAKAQIEIVVANCKRVVHATHFQVAVAAYGNTGRVECGHILRRECAPSHGTVATTVSPVRPIARAVDTEQDTGVRDGVVGRKQQCPDQSNVGLKDVAEQLFEPVRVDGLDAALE